MDKRVREISRFFVALRREFAPAVWRVSRTLLSRNTSGSVVHLTTLSGSGKKGTLENHSRSNLDFEPASQSRSCHLPEVWLTLPFCILCANDALQTEANSEREGGSAEGRKGRSTYLNLMPPPSVTAPFPLSFAFARAWAYVGFGS